MSSDIAVVLFLREENDIPVPRTLFF